jgi:hypothetical protein
MFDKKIGEIRPNQFITTYGPGSIIDAVNDSLTVLDLEYWDESNIGMEIRDTRLANFMNVRHFYSPQTGNSNCIPVRSFPYYHVCSNKKCNLLFDMREGFDLDKYNDSQGTVKCPKCGHNAYPARFITVCENGHMSDFPWRWWVHKGNTSCNGELTFESTGSTSTLAGLTVRCTCGAHRTMAGATQKENFAGYTCPGEHPHRPYDKHKPCKMQVIPCQRGASNVYFGVTRSAISIPPWTNPINDIMSNNRAVIESYAEDFGEMGLKKAYTKFFEPQGYSYDEFFEAYQRMKQKIKEFIELKEMEYQAITHHDDVSFKHDVRYFKAEEVDLLDSLKPYISRVIKIHRLREVRVLTGFTRLEAPEPEIDDPKHIVKLRSDRDEKWLPAVAINGEGVFIELNRETLKNWMEIPSVKKRSDKYTQYYNEYCESRGWSNYKTRNAEYVLLHTLSHLLIKGMSMKSGYSSSALHERIYSSDDMSGILIYTGAPDAEGSLGGLVALGGMDKFVDLLADALKDALVCTTDPECFMREPTQTRISGAACHSCTMVSETACENGNRLLDRALVVPLPDHEEMGYFRNLVNDLCGLQI